MLDVLCSARQGHFTKANEITKKNTPKNYICAKLQMVNVLLVVKEEKLAIFFSFYSQTARVNLIIFRQKVSVKGFNGKQCKKYIYMAFKQGVLQPSL